MQSHRRWEEGSVRFVVVLLCAYHAYLMHCHTVAVAGKGTAEEQVCAGSSLSLPLSFSLCASQVGALRR